MNSIEVSESEKEAVYSWLRDYNHERNGDFIRSLEVEGTEIPIFLSARDETGKVIGGLEGLMIHKWLRIDIMAVNPFDRAKGAGTDLVARAEGLALQYECQHAFVDTMSYQAPGFYEGLGYEVVGRIPDWDSHGHEKLYLTKTLPVRRVEK
ncbi:GNAT family N-acetyltransferase [bacterium]|nr:GNAT family N-acetyltransferase [bacterium]